MIGGLCLVVGLLGQWLLGVGVAGVVLSWRVGGKPSTCDGSRRESAELPLAELAGLGCVLGIGLTAWLLFAWSVCGGPLGRGISLSLAAVGFVIGGPVVMKRLWRRCGAASEPLPQTHDQRREAAWCRLCQWLIGGLILLSFGQTLMTPQHFWDERSIFSIKGLVLFEDGSVRSRDLADPDFVQYHPRYPLLLPLAEQHIYALFGAADDRWSKLVFPLLYAGLVWTLAGVLLRHLAPGVAWLFALLTATIPVLMPYELGFLSGQADAPMACFHGVAALYVWDALRQTQRDEGDLHGARAALLAGLCGGLAAFTKDEGIAFLMVDSVALLLVSAFGCSQFRRGTRTLMIVAASSALVLGTWFAHRRGLPTTTEMSYLERASLSLLLERVHVFAWEAQHLASRMWREWSWWGLHWWLVLFGAAVAPRRLLSSAQMFLVLDVLGGVLALMVAGMLAPAQLDEHIGGSSARFLMQLAPVAILFAAGQLGSFTERPRRESGLFPVSK